MINKIAVVISLALATGLTQANSLSPASPPGITWIKSLIMQYEAPITSSSTLQQRQAYANNIFSLAPELKQFHIRVTGSSDADAIANTAVAILNKFKNTPNFKLGFHPDWSKGSYDSWKCDNKSVKCIISSTIAKLNSIEAKIQNAIPSFLGFDILSLEQSYIIDGWEDSPSYNTCFTDPKLTNQCPSYTKKHTQKSMQIGNVMGPSSGDDNTIYAPDKLQWGYPQLYNLDPVIYTTAKLKQFAQTYNAALGLSINVESSVPSSSQSPQNLFVIDACSTNSCSNIKSGNSKKYPNGKISPSQALEDGSHSSYTRCNAQTAAFFTALAGYNKVIAQTSTAKATGGGIIWSLSGEPLFLGASCKWSVEQLNQFMITLKKILLYKCTNDTTGTCNANTVKNLQFGIWSFSTISLFKGP